MNVWRGGPRPCRPNSCMAGCVNRRILLVSAGGGGSDRGARSSGHRAGISPSLRFVAGQAPMTAASRPGCGSAGLFLYDHSGGRKAVARSRLNRRSWLATKSCAAGSEFVTRPRASKIPIASSTTAGFVAHAPGRRADRVADCRTRRVRSDSDRRSKCWARSRSKSAQRRARERIKPARSCEVARRPWVGRRGWSSGRGRPMRKAKVRLVQAGLPHRGGRKLYVRNDRAYIFKSAPAARLRHPYAGRFQGP